jgi:uracil-DNA glycosylase family 4
MLDRMLSAAGLARSDVYATNVLKCRTPKNRTPLPEEVAACAPFLGHQLGSIRPRVLVALGGTALRALVGDDGRRVEGVPWVEHMCGSWHEYRGIPVLSVPHPAYLLRNPESVERALAAMATLRERLSRETAETNCPCAGSGHVTERIAGGRLRVVYPCPTCNPSAWEEVGGWDDLDVSGFRVGSEGLTIVVSDLQPTVQDGDGSDTVEREGAGSARDAQPAPAPRATGMAPMHTQYDAPPTERQP